MYQKPLQKSQFAECSILCCLGLMIFWWSVLDSNPRSKELMSTATCECLSVTRYTLALAITIQCIYRICESV